MKIIALRTLTALQYDENGNLREPSKRPHTRQGKIKRRLQLWVLKWTNRWHKSNILRKFEYNGARLDRIANFFIQSQREAFKTNPYKLSSIFYLFLFAILYAWAIGSVICSYFEGSGKDASGNIATVCRGIIGSLPAIVQITLFLFPPLYVSH